MHEINFSREEQNALARIDVADLKNAIKCALETELANPLYPLRISECGQYVLGRLSDLERELRSLYRAKSIKNKEVAWDGIRRAARYLIDAFVQTKAQMEKEKKEADLFYVFDDQIPPYFIDQHISIQIRYQWRKNINDEWIVGFYTITLSDLVSLRRHEVTAVEWQNHQQALIDIHDRLKDSGLQDLKNYFQNGGDGSAIPKTFEAKRGPDGCLNNHSADWRRA